MSDNVRACLIDAYRMRETLSASTLLSIQNDIRAGIHSCKIIIEKITEHSWAAEELAFYQLLEKGFIKELE